MSNYKIIFESERILFIQITEDLIDEYMVIVNDEEIQAQIGLNRHRYTKTEELEWIRDNLKKRKTIYSMIEKETYKFIGNIEIKDMGNKIGELGICITKDQQNKHFGQESIKAIIDYAFNVLKYENIELNVFNFNKRAQACYEKVGFIRNGEGKKPGDIHMIYNRR